MKIDFHGRRALVTGGTRGIGAAIARHLADAGATVVATASSEESKAAHASPGIQLEVVDFASPQDTERFAHAMAEFEFDVLINNAGINKIAPFPSIAMDDWDRIQTINVRAPALLCRALVPGMCDRRYGRIVNISSIFGEVSRSERGAYTTSKYALRGMTRTLAIECAKHNVLVNAVAPGFIDTELTRRVLGERAMNEMAARIPMGRLGTVDEIARLVTFLASETNSYLTGQHIVIDGGFTSE